MAQCSEANAVGGAVALFESAGVPPEPAALDVLNPAEKAGYAGEIGKFHEKGSKELDGFEQELNTLRDNGVNSRFTAHYRNPISIFGEGLVRPIINAATEVKKEILQNKLTRSQARVLWREKVVPVVDKQEQAFRDELGSKDYLQQRADKYLADMREGTELFSIGNSAPQVQIAKTTAGNITGASPIIAGLDHLELLNKGLTLYGPKNFAQGMATLIFKHGPKAWGRISEFENAGLYSGSPFEITEKPLIEIGSTRIMTPKPVAWLSERIDPMYYSSNFLHNGAVYIGRAAGVGEQEAIRKIAFTPELGNTPEYMRNSWMSADTTWARYTVEASKFWLQTHGNLKKALESGDVKKAAGAAGSLFTFYLTLQTAGGSRAMIPKGLDKIINKLYSDDEQDVFEAIDAALPWLNLPKKTTGVDLSSKIQFGAPTFGLAYSAVERKFGSAGKGVTDTGNYVKSGDWVNASVEVFRLLHTVGSMSIRSPLVSGTSEKILDFSIDYNRGELEDPAPIAATEKFLGKEAVKAFK